jgi:hypothetical protein
VTEPRSAPPEEQAPAELDADEKAKLRKRQKWALLVAVALALLFGVGWYLDHLEEKERAEEQAAAAACDGARRAARRAWFRYLTSVALHHTEKAVGHESSPEEQKKTIAKIETWEPPAADAITAAELDRLRDIISQVPPEVGDAPDVDALAAALEACPAANAR